MVPRRRHTGTVEETPWWLEVNGRRVVQGTTTPERIEALAMGRLIVEGYASGASDLRSLSLIHDPAGCVGVRVQVLAESFAAAEAMRAHRQECGCGVRHFLNCEPGGLVRPRRLPVPPAETFPTLFRALFSAADRYQRTGGIHAAALTDGEMLVHEIEDVGRHNAVDKAVGWAALEGVDAGSLGLLLSARVSAEIAVKAARGGLAWLASRSIPTDLAVEIAVAAELPVLARAAGKERRLFGVADGDTDEW